MTNKYDEHTDGCDDPDCIVHKHGTIEDAVNAARDFMSRVEADNDSDRVRGVVDYLPFMASLIILESQFSRFRATKKEMIAAVVILTIRAVKECSEHDDERDFFEQLLDDVEVNLG